LKRFSENGCINLDMCHILAGYLAFAITLSIFW
jgi:hypothetical protein